MDGCDIDDNGYMPISWKQVKARKRYKCSQCPNPIEIGTLHIVHTFVDEDGIGHSRHHGAECEYYWAAESERINPALPLDGD